MGPTPTQHDTPQDTARGPGGGRRLRLVAALLVAPALVAAAAAPALAGPDRRPEVVVDETFETDITFPFEFAPGEFDPGPCGVDGVRLQEVVDVRETEFTDRDGEFVKATLHIRGTSTWTGPGGDAVTEHWAWNGTMRMDGETVTFTENGNFWNVHQPGEGVVVHEKGRHIITVGPEGFDHEVVGGPHEVDELGLAPLCEAIGAG